MAGLAIGDSLDVKEGVAVDERLEDEVGVAALVAVMLWD